ncbi:hypothetical protein SAMN05216599_102230 [Pseudomonas cichorii]|nr:hypothetical protein SAMN05216599_102230 [Pseudomonas cichorii]
MKCKTEGLKELAQAKASKAPQWYKTKESKGES